MRSTKSVKHKRLFSLCGNALDLTGSYDVCVCRTNVLLTDGVRPSVVSEHLIGQADYPMPFDVAHLKEFILRSCC